MMGFLSMNHPAPSARRSARDLGGGAALGKPGPGGDRIERGNGRIEAIGGIATVEPARGD